MSRFLGLRARLQHMLRRRDADARMDEEMQFHLEMETQKHVRAGLTDDAARRRSLASFGGVERHKEALRDDRRVPFFEVLWLDVAFGLRSLRRDQSFTAVAIVTLALGIGMATTMFSVLNAIALDEREVKNAEDVAVLWTAPPLRASEHLPLSFGDLNAYAQATRAFDGVAGVIFQGAVGVVMTDGPRVLPIAATWVTGNYFAVLGVTPVLGRQLTPEDDVVGAAPVMVISYALWQNRFAGVAAVIGQRLQLNAKQYTIVGVMPRGFEYPRHTDTWLPVLSTYPATQEPEAFGPDVMLFDAIGRLRQGISQTAATNELTAFLHDTDARRPASRRGTIAIVTSFMDRMSGDVRGTLLACSVAVGLLLLVACVNVANLLLIRGALRTQELAIRSALGAGRGRLIRQLVTEASVIASAGCIVAIALAWLAIRAIRVFAPAGIPHRELIGIDTRVLLVALAVTVLATITSGLLPAIVGARGDLGLWLRGGRAMSGVHRQSHLLRLGLVVGQIAMAVVVLISAGLVTRSLRELQQVDMGFNGAQLRIVETLLPPDAALTHSAQLAVQEAMLARVADIPGVVAATALPKPPYAAEGGWIAMYSADGQDEAERARNPAVNFEVVADNYFGALGVTIVAGRSFDARDRDGAQPVAIVSASVARNTWPRLDPIGRRIKLGAPDGRGPWMTVIGVAAETRYRDLTTTRPTLYLPTRQFAGPVPMTLAVRTRADAGDLRAAIRGALADAHPALRIVTEASLDERLSAPLARPRFGAVLFGTFAVITLVLCVIGIYGAIAATVRERQIEFGIRLALGERPASIRSRILRLGGILTLSGAVLGVVGALIGTRLLQTLLFGVSAVDPLTYATVIVTVVGVAAVACWVPAQRAARVNPIDVLR